MTCKWGLNIALVMIFTEIVGDSGSAVHYPKLCHVCGESSTKLDGIQTWSISTLLGAVPTLLSRYVLTLETDVHMTWIFFPQKNAIIRLILLTCFWKHMEKIWSNIKSWSPPLHQQSTWAFLVAFVRQRSVRFPKSVGGHSVGNLHGTSSIHHFSFLKIPTLDIMRLHKFRCFSKKHIQDVEKRFWFFWAEKYVEKQSSCLAFPVSIVKVQRSWLEEAVGQIAIPLDSWIIRPQPSSNMKMIKCIIRLSSFNITIYIYISIYVILL